jgi:hypothetical protein
MGAQTIMSKQIFDTYGSLVIPNLIPVEFCQFFTHILLRQQYLQELKGDLQVPNAAAIMGKNESLIFETLQERLWPRIESIVGEELLPTYSYARLYTNEDILKTHTDRDACEISVTIQLGRSHHYAWPIYMGEQRFDLAEGDGVLYKGCEIEHGRKKCEGPDGYYSGQVFIHFVRKNGEFAGHYKDVINQGQHRHKVDFTRNRTYLMEMK